MFFFKPSEAKKTFDLNFNESQTDCTSTIVFKSDKSPNIKSD